MRIVDPNQKVGIQEILISDDGYLVFHMTNGNDIDAGNIVGNS